MLAGYYPKKNKEKHQKRTDERYQDLSEEQKNKNYQYSHERQRNISKTISYKHLNQGSMNLVDMGTTYLTRIVST